MQVEVYTINGAPTGEMLELDASVFGIEPNDHAIYMAVRSIQANQHQGLTKSSRGMKSAGREKTVQAKKTGRARAGSTRSPIWVGGGSIFGPHPHDYVVSIPAKVRKLARKSALSYKVKDGAIKLWKIFPSIR